MYKFALVGKDISHSLSQSIYERLLQQAIDYTLLDYEKSEDIPTLSYIFNNGLKGLSITSPYKSYFYNDVICEDELAILYVRFSISDFLEKAL